jgi:2,3-bisphosphoglycerate-dependent phosphoglycerate mutase
MRLFFIRHAQSTNNAMAAQGDEGRFRSSDPELTDLGRQQARKLAAFLGSGNPSGGRYEDGQSSPGFELTHIYTSLMVRSVATGAVIAEHVGLPLVAWEEVHERGGIYIEDEKSGNLTGLPGKDRTYFEAHFPQLVLPEGLGEGGWWDCQPFEPHEQWQARARRFLEGLVDRHKGSSDRVAVVSHGGFYNDFLRVLTGLDGDAPVWFELNNAAISRVDFREDRTKVVYHNRVDYLPAEMVT